MNIQSGSVILSVIWSGFPVLTGWPRPNYKISVGLKFLFYKMEIKTTYLPRVPFLDLGDCYVGVFVHSLWDNSLSYTFFYLAL